MAQLRQDFAEFQKRGALIVVVGPENSQAFREYFTQNLLPFLGLPDPGHGVLKQFGQEVNLFKLGRMPAQVIIDRRGVVRYAHYGHEMSDIPPNDELLSILDELNQAAD
jgi:peroxiredoxin Q/BCP